MCSKKIPFEASYIYKGKRLVVDTAHPNAYPQCHGVFCWLPKRERERERTSIVMKAELF